MSNLEIIIISSLRPRPILAVLGIFFIQLFPKWTACSPITYTNNKDNNKNNDDDDDDNDNDDDDNDNDDDDDDNNNNNNNNKVFPLL